MIQILHPALGARFWSYLWMPTHKRDKLVWKENRARRFSIKTAHQVALQLLKWQCRVILCIKVKSILLIKAAYNFKMTKALIKQLLRTLIWQRKIWWFWLNQCLTMIKFSTQCRRWCHVWEGIRKLIRHV